MLTLTFAFVILEFKVKTAFTGRCPVRKEGMLYVSS